MKETLRKRLENEISKIDGRCDQLLKNFKEYKEDNKLEYAIKTDIKWRELKMVSQSLIKLLA
tara:strand:+ start:518 stop:703 length:186 start_codon:yes stop_codon:yes gene_type:complete